MKERRLTAIMFTDIVGYTALMGEDEDKASEMVRRNRKIQLSLIQHHKGTCLKEIGDGIMASFPSAINAVFCAVHIQQFAQKENIPLRVGIHQGDVLFENNDVLGDGVNVASRIEQVTDPGNISISESVFKEIENKPDIKSEYLNEMALKNVKEPVKLHKVLYDKNTDLDYTLIKDPIPGTRNRLAQYAFLAVLIIVAMLAVVFIRKMINSPGEDIERSIAVLPFDNESTDESNIYFVNGMMEEIRNDLAKIGDLRVISKTSTDKYRETDLSIKEIAQELEVGFLLEGTVQKAGNQVKIHAQLIKAETDEHVWAETYQKELNDVFSIQSDIAQTIANALYAVITPEELMLIESTPTSNITAYDFFLRAREQHNQFWLYHDRNDLEKAIILYRRALENDSTFARAYTGLAFAFQDKHRYSTYLDVNYMDSVLVLTNKALSFDDQLDEAYYVRGLYFASQEDGFNESMKDMNKALEINPNYVEVYKHKSVVSAWVFEDYIEAIKNGLIAVKLDQSTSLPITLKRLAEFYYDIGLFDAARSYSNRAFLLDNDSSVYFAKLAWINLSEGALREGLNAAIQSYQQDTTNMMSLILITMFSNSLKNEEIGYPYALKLLDMFKLYQMTTPNDFHRIGYLFWLKGKHEEAEFYLNEQQKWCEESIRLGRSYAKMYGAHHDLACVLAFKGETERAIELLSEVNDNKDFFPSWYITQFENEPFFESIRDDELYQQILSDMKAKYQKEHERVKAWMQEEGII